MNKQEHDFYISIGIPREVLQKKLKNRTVLNMSEALKAIKNHYGDQVKNPPIFKESEEEARERQRQQRIRAFGMQHLPSLITEAFIEEFDNQGLSERINIPNKDFNKIKSWTPETPFVVPGTKRHRAFFLSGKTGVGKSTLMQAHAIKIYDSLTEIERRQGNVVKYISVSEFMTTYFNAKEDHIKASLESSFQYCRFLYLDDIGAEKFSDGKEDLLKRLLQWRIEPTADHKTKWTFFCSNFSLEALAYSDPVKRRIRDLAIEVDVGGTFRDPKGPGPSNIFGNNGNPSFS